MMISLWAAIIGGLFLFLGSLRQLRRADRLERRRDQRRREAQRLIAHDDASIKLELAFLREDYLAGIYSDREFLAEIKRLGLSNRQIVEFLDVGEPNEVACYQAQHHHQRPQDQHFNGRAVLDRP